MVSMKAFIQLFFLAALLFFGASTHAGRDKPILNIYNTNVNWPSGVEATDKKVERAIIIACTQLGWICSVTKPGEIHGRLNLRTHQADVRIPYNIESYSIIFEAAVNLRHNVVKNTIHRNYNNWIMNLQKNINTAIAATP